MKKIILIFSFISAVLQADEVVTRAIAKLIDENRAMRSEISILQLEAEKLETLQYNFKELNKELKELKKRLSILEKSDQHIVTRQPHKGTKAIITAQLLNVRKSPSFGDNILFALQKDDIVRVVETSDQWCLININDKQGWVASQWLTPTDGKR